MAIRAGRNMSIIELAELFGEWKYIPERRGEDLQLHGYC